MLAAVVALVATSTVGCVGGGDESPSGRTSVVVLAASSLARVVPALGEAFAATEPGYALQARYGGSAALVRQVADGAPADLLVTADRVVMERVAANVEAPALIARNRLEIAVPVGNPGAIRGLADLGRGGLRVVVCAPEVPCGRLAAIVLDRASVHLRPASLEQDVRAVAAKVTLGEADAGIVYATDVRARRSDLQGVAIDGADDPEVQAEYVGAVVRTAENRGGARAFLAFLRSTEGQRILERHGFDLP